MNKDHIIAKVIRQIINALLNIIGVFILFLGVCFLILNNFITAFFLILTAVILISPFYKKLITKFNFNQNWQKWKIRVSFALFGFFLAILFVKPIETPPVTVNPSSSPVIPTVTPTTQLNPVATSSPTSIPIASITPIVTPSVTPTTKLNPVATSVPTLTPTSTPMASITPIVTPTIIPMPNKLDFPKKSCGQIPTDNNHPITWYPVFIDNANIDEIRNTYCNDAVSRIREKTGKASVQLASFYDYEKAVNFAKIVGGEVGEPDQIEQYKDPIASEKLKSQPTGTNNNVSDDETYHDFSENTSYTSRRNCNSPDDLDVNLNFPLRKITKLLK